jgi:hypothetical protein
MALILSGNLQAVDKALLSCFIDEAGDLLESEEQIRPGALTETQIQGGGGKEASPMPPLRTSVQWRLACALFDLSLSLISAFV